MAENVTLIDPRRLERSPDNPRLIFRQDELEQLEQSIKENGILVPLTIYKDRNKYILLDGERRWRCALKLGLESVPVIVQPKPDRMRRIMIMFATHKARKDWDPLPTALKLADLESEFLHRFERLPNEKELSGIASISRGEVRRLKKLLNLPEEFKKELMLELELPRSEQRLTVDQVLETTKGAEALRKREVIDEQEENNLSRAIVHKFKRGLIKSTVDPRKLVRIARAVERNELEKRTARRVVMRLIDDESYTIDQAFSATVEQADYQYGTRQLADRVQARLREIEKGNQDISPQLANVLRQLAAQIKKLL